MATFTSLAFIVDPLLLVTCWWATADWDPASRRWAFWGQFAFMFAFTKVVKLMGLFLRNPGDVCFLPVSILFGYFHGFIKLYALCTLRMVSWTAAVPYDDRPWRVLSTRHASYHATFRANCSSRHPGAAAPMPIPTTTLA